MLTVEALERWFWGASVAALAVLAVRLWANGLYRVYRFFFCYVLFRVVRSVLLFLVPMLVQWYGNGPAKPVFATRQYALIWICTEPLTLVLSVLMVLELFSLVLKDHAGIAKFSRWALWFALGLSLAIASVSMVPDVASTADRFPLVHFMGVLDRGVLSSLVIFLLLITVFLVWFPVPLNRNVVAHAIIFAVSFLCTSMGHLVRNLGGTDITPSVNVVFSAISLFCVLLWIAFLTPKGEAKVVTVRRHWRSGQEDQLVEQLAAINATLLRSARK